LFELEHKPQPISKTVQHQISSNLSPQNDANEYYDVATLTLDSTAICGPPVRNKYSLIDSSPNRPENRWPVNTILQKFEIESKWINFYRFLPIQSVTLRDVTVRTIDRRGGRVGQ
jgi:hypothetical protein